MTITFYLTSQLRTNSYLQWQPTPAKPSPKPDDTGPILRRPMGLPITAGCDTAWDWTRVCSEASSTEMQCFRTLLHLGALLFWDTNKMSDSCNVGEAPERLWSGRIRFSKDVSLRSPERTRSDQSVNSTWLDLTCWCSISGEETESKTTL